jgi:hypothetical protein
MEWTNKELKRRSKVVGYSIAGMILRQSVSILIGIDEDWIVGNTYNNNGTVLKKEDSRASSRFYRKLLCYSSSISIYLFQFFHLLISFQRAYGKLLYSILLFIAYKSTKIDLSR